MNLYLPLSIAAHASSCLGVNFAMSLSKSNCFGCLAKNSFCRASLAFDNVILSITGTLYLRPVKVRLLEYLVPILAILLCGWFCSYITHNRPFVLQSLGKGMPEPITDRVGGVWGAPSDYIICCFFIPLNISQTCLTFCQHYDLSQLVNNNYNLFCYVLCSYRAYYGIGIAY